METQVTLRMSADEFDTLREAVEGFRNSKYVESRDTILDAPGRREARLASERAGFLLEAINRRGSK